MRICIDLDGTIAQVKKDGESYADVQPMAGASQALRSLKDNGFYIIIHTARNMGTFNNNLGQVIAAQAAIVTNWLCQHDIPYDELLFGKPNVDYFIDDKNILFHDWATVQEFLMEKKNV